MDAGLTGVDRQRVGLLAPGNPSPNPKPRSHGGGGSFSGLIARTQWNRSSVSWACPWEASVPLDGARSSGTVTDPDDCRVSFKAAILSWSTTSNVYIYQI